MKTKINIIGAGLAGCILALILDENDFEINLYHKPNANTSSDIAAGIFNPISGKFLTLGWNAFECLKALNKLDTYYQSKFKKTYLVKKQVLRLFSSIAEQNDWIGKLDTFDTQQLSIKYTDTAYNQLKNTFGGMIIEPSGYALIPELINTIHNYFKSKKQFIEHAFDYQIDDTQMHIFCEGNLVHHNPLFNYLPFQYNHGEILTIQSHQIPEDYIINQGIFILPLGNHTFKIGSTYNWVLKEAIISNEGKLQILVKLEQMGITNYEIINHQAGIRPATRDRRPFVGKHHKYNHQFIFNGFGSKGVLLIPYCANQILNFIKNGTELNPQIDIKRYEKYFPI